MPATLRSTISVVGIDIGKNSFHVVGLDDRGAIVLRQKWSRGQVEARLMSFVGCDPIRHRCDAAQFPASGLQV